MGTKMRLAQAKCVTPFICHILLGQDDGDCQSACTSAARLSCQATKIAHMLCRSPSCLLQALEHVPRTLFTRINCPVQAAAKGPDRSKAQVHKSAQFIVTTFHPQIVAVSDKTYGVEHRQRVSTVHECEREVALRFVRNDASHANRANQGADGAFPLVLALCPPLVATMRRVPVFGLVGLRVFRCSCMRHAFAACEPLLICLCRRRSSASQRQAGAPPKQAPKGELD